MKAYKSNHESAALLADLQQDGRYEVELRLDLREQTYKLLLQQCQSQTPIIYTQLQRP